MTVRRYGGFWRRLLAFIVDEIILYFVTLALFLVGLLAMGLRGEKVSRIMSSPDNLMQGMGGTGLLYMAASMLAAMAYFTWFHGTLGRTPGKMLMGLRVIQASGDPMTPGVAFLRWVGYLISAIPFSLGFLWVAFDRRKQGWHDKIAMTLVIRKEDDEDRTADAGEPRPAASAAIQPSGGEPPAPITVSEAPPEGPRSGDIAPPA
jgi:uncharacterized RDD family membrane protein YckC